MNVLYQLKAEIFCNSSFRLFGNLCIFRRLFCWRKWKYLPGESGVTVWFLHIVQHKSWDGKSEVLGAFYLRDSVKWKYCIVWRLSVFLSTTNCHSRLLFQDWYWVGALLQEFVSSLWTTHDHFLKKIINCRPLLILSTWCTWWTTEPLPVRWIFVLIYSLSRIVDFILGTFDKFVT